MLIRLIKDWKSESTFPRQTPSGSMRWGEFTFTEEESIDECDLLIVFNRLTAPIKIKARYVWLIAMEPPTPAHNWYKANYKQYDKVITQFLGNTQWDNTHGALPWYVGKSYDQLSMMEYGTDVLKNKSVSCISSKLNWMKGHELRLGLIKFLTEESLEFDLFGRDFRFVEDKWDALSEYKYSIAIENTSVPHYWTEKIADCFLSWTMPIYWGATNIEEYFPKESFLRVDPRKPKESLNKIRRALDSDLHAKSIDAINEARERVLNKYQLFPYVANQLRNVSLPKNSTEYHLKETIAPWEDGYNMPLNRRVQYHLRKLVNRKPY